MRNSASGMFVQCNLLSFGELLRKSIYAFRGRIQSSDNTIIKMYGEFSGASSLKCLEMVAYHTIHWLCDSVIILPCNACNYQLCLHACQFMLCMDYESEIKIYYYYIIKLHAALHRSILKRVKMHVSCFRDV